MDGTREGPAGGQGIGQKAGHEGEYEPTYYTVSFLSAGGTRKPGRGPRFPAL